MMDSQQEYEALLAKWGFDADSLNTANTFYEFSKKVNSLLSQAINKIINSVNVKPQNLQLGLNP